MPRPPHSGPPAGFHTTRWSLVARAGRADPKGRRALDELCTVYWPAVYAFYRRAGLDAEAAGDLTQGLILDLLARLAKVARADLGMTRGTAVSGTPQYMAPEQWRASGAVDHRADIFSLGVVIYEMLTGQLPVGHFDPPSRHKGVPRGLDEVVRRSLAQQPEQRYQSVREVEADVERQKRTAPAGDGAARRWPRVLAIALVLIVVTALLAVAANGLVDSSGPGGAAARVRAMRPPELLGKSPAEVLACLGPPLSVTAGAAMQEWEYRTATGEVLPRALTFSGGVVVSHDAAAHVLQPNPIPGHAPCAGQSFADVVRELGPPADQRFGSVVATYRFANGIEVTVSQGVVIGVESRK